MLYSVNSADVNDNLILSGNGGRGGNGRSNRTIPIPGVRTVAQVQENLGAIQFGPLEPSQMKEIDSLLERRAT